MLLKNDELWKKIHHKYTQGKQFKDVRKIVKERDGEKCQCCPNEEGLPLITHHRSYEHFMEGGKTEADDCILLCRKCHFMIHRNKSIAKQFQKEQNEWMENHKDLLTV